MECRKLLIVLFSYTRKRDDSKSLETMLHTRAQQVAVFVSYRRQWISNVFDLPAWKLPSANYQSTIIVFEIFLNLRLHSCGLGSRHMQGDFFKRVALFRRNLFCLKPDAHADMWRIVFIWGAIFMLNNIVLLLYFFFF